MYPSYSKTQAEIPNCTQSLLKYSQSQMLTISSPLNQSVNGVIVTILNYSLSIGIIGLVITMGSTNQEKCLKLASHSPFHFEVDFWLILHIGIVRPITCKERKSQKEKGRCSFQVNMNTEHFF